MLIHSTPQTKSNTRHDKPLAAPNPSLNPQNTVHTFTLSRHEHILATQHCRDRILRPSRIVEGSLRTKITIQVACDCCVVVPAGGSARQASHSNNMKRSSSEEHDNSIGNLDFWRGSVPETQSSEKWLRARLMVRAKL